MHKPISMFCALALGALVYASSTHKWRDDSQTAFEKGTLRKMSLRSDGRLMLAPEIADVFDAGASYMLAVAEDKRGNVYFGGGGVDASTTKLHVADANGVTKVASELPGINISAIAIDSQDRVYAATTPDGKVFRIGADGKATEFYDPKAKYIWAMAFNTRGELFVSTGDKGEIHRVLANGTGTVFFKADDTHARSLAIDPQGNVYAGTEPSGLVIRINPAGEGFVVHQASRKEVTALALDTKGNLYAAAVGARAVAAPPAPQAQPPTAQAAAQAVLASQSQARLPILLPAGPAAAPAVTGGSEVFRVEPDGFVRRLWTNASEIAYAIAFDAQGRAIIGTGNKGNLYRLDSDLMSTLLGSVTPTQITALATGRNGRIWAVTGNIGKLMRIGPGVEKEGTYESEVRDAAYFTNWGRLSATMNAAGGSISFSSRSGNLDTPQRNWSTWAEVPMQGDGGRISSPAARFFQYRITLRAATDGRSPDVGEVETAYLAKNIAPSVEAIELTRVNFRFPPSGAPFTPGATLALSPVTRNARPQQNPAPPSDAGPATMNYAKGFVGARWLVRDDNADPVESKIEIRGVRETAWKLLKDKLRERAFSWDGSAYTDGDYVVRVTTSDAPGNPPDQALESSMVSDPFTIDNTPPQVTGLAATRAANRVEVRWRAADALNELQKAEYSIDGGDWTPVEPTTRLTDSRQHDYVLVLANVAAGEHTIAVRVMDANDNQSVEKTVVP